MGIPYLISPDGSETIKGFTLGELFPTIINVGVSLSNSREPMIVSIRPMTNFYLAE